MVDRDKIQFDLVKLLNGGRLLRLTEPQSGLTLEKKLAPTDAVVRQKEKLLRAFCLRSIRVIRGFLKSAPPYVGCYFLAGH